MSLETESPSIGSNSRLVSAVIPALNEEHFLPILLRSLCEQVGVRLEVLVVEGRSDDRTAAVARQVSETNSNPNVSIAVHTVEVRNVSYQRNFGVAQSRGELLLFLDADVRLPHPRWAVDIVNDFFRRDAAIVSCRFKPIEHHWMARLNYLSLFLFHKTMQYINPYAMGAMLLTRRESFERVGGFDERLTLNEDANLVKRISEFGRFRMLNAYVWVSARRFIKGGYLKTSLNYLRIFWNRTRHGENTSAMGYWDEQSPEKKA